MITLVYGSVKGVSFYFYEFTTTPPSLDIYYHPYTVVSPAAWVRAKTPLIPLFQRGKLGWGYTSVISSRCSWAAGVGIDKKRGGWGEGLPILSFQIILRPGANGNAYTADTIVYSLSHFFKFEGCLVTGVGII
jgi:hypothetical protein